MEHEFEYLVTKTYTGSLDVEDIGNCVIKANNDKAQFFYFWVKTNLGQTKILQIGPIVEKDLQYLSYNFSTSYYTLNDYSERLIIKAIDKFLNSYNISQAIEITEEEFKEDCKVDIFRYMED